MPITEEQRVRRKRHIGSSDMSAILGLNPYRTAYDVWLDKTGQLEQQEGNDRMDFGNAVEETILDYAERELGTLRRNITIGLAGTPIESNLDAQCEADECPVEAKSTGIFGPIYGEWGEPGTDQIPDWILPQCHIHLIVTGAATCYVPALIGTRGLVMYQVEANERMKRIILERADEFWRYVEDGTPPPESTPSPSILKHIRREPKKVIDIPVDAVARWLKAKEEFARAEAEKDLAQAAVIAAMSDAECGRSELGDVTYYEQTRKAHEVKESKFRVLRFKKGR